jgi:hypothetical protein
MQGSTQPASMVDTSASPATFASRPLPPRVRQLCQGVHELLLAELERGVLNTLAEYENQLFALAEQARNSGVQAHFLQAQRDVRARSGGVLPAFKHNLEAALAGLRDPPVEVARGIKPAVAALGGLSLVDQGEMDENVVLNEIASRAEMRAGLALFLLGQRFGVLAARPAYDAEHLPIGPVALCRMLANACVCLELSPEHRHLLLRQFDKQVVQFAGTLYEAINAWLASHGVLPHLTYVPFRARPQAQAQPGKRPRAEPSPEPAAAEAPAPPPTEAGAGAASPYPAPWMPPMPRPAAPTTPARFAGSAESAGVPASAPAGRWPGMPSLAPAAIPEFLMPPDHVEPGPWNPAPEGAAPAAPASAVDVPAGATAGGGSEPGDQVLFDTLRHLLTNRRSLVGKLAGKFGSAPAAPEPTAVASAQDLQTVLDRLQHLSSAPVMREGKVQPRSIAHLKQDLLMHLRTGQPDGAAVALPPEANDTIELVGMLLDHLTRDLRPGSPASGLLTKLQVPLLRVALDDKTFFSRADHPARQLLNSVAETADWFSSDDPADKAMLERMRGVVDRMVTEFTGDMSLMQTLLNDVHQQLQVQVKRAEVAERRHIEAARGKEKLELARIQAAGAVERLTQGRQVPRFAATLLNQSWSDVLALTMLRHGPESPQVQQQVAVAERVISAAEKRASAASAPLPQIDPDVQALRGEIEEGLLQVGYHADDAQAVSTKLTSTQEDEAEDAASRTELSLRLKQRTRFGADVEGHRVDDPSELSEAERHEYQNLKCLAFGTWFEFQDEAGGWTRRRLSWYSPMTGHSLFVNHRGQRVGEYHLTHLAKEMAAGRVRLLADANTSLVDRAWKAIVGALKTFTGRPAEAAAT